MMVLGKIKPWLLYYGVEQKFQGLLISVEKLLYYSIHSTENAYTSGYYENTKNIKAQNKGNFLCNFWSFVRENETIKFLLVNRIEYLD